MPHKSAFSEYTVRIDPLTLELHVSLVLEGEFVRDGLVLQVPSWVPGDYDFEPYGRDVFEVKVVEPAGVEIKRDGLAPGDVITNIGDFDYSWEALSWAAAQSHPFSLTVKRGHRVLKFQMTPQAADKVVGLEWTGNPDLAKLISDWLGQEFAPHDGHVFPVDFYENFHGIEAML
ncbi:hypothetical protein [Sedimentitalea sp.]|uniref:M61 family metallopeptidase n=1 Tax=Sedimentitalea sp. TaxID=2048915 RepID=UPI003298D6A1